jgi:hypothetical protein
MESFSYYARLVARSSNTYLIVHTWLQVIYFLLRVLKKFLGRKTFSSSDEFIYFYFL